MAQKSRVLMFTTAFRPMIGGSEIALEEMVRHLPDIFFDIVTPRHRRAFLKKECGNNYCVYRVGFGFGQLLDKLSFPCLGALKAFRLMFKHKYTASHAYQASYGGGAAWLVKVFVSKIRFILTLQEGKGLDKQSRGVRFLRSLMIKKADVVTAISNYLAEYAKKINPRAEIILIPNGVDLDTFTPDGPHDPKTIITTGRLVEKNGTKDLIAAIAIVKKKISDVKLLILADGEQKEELEKLSVFLGLEHSVEFLGEVSHGLVPKYLARASIFARPSLSEGLGSSFLEAMAAGLVVIGTNVGGIPDFLKDGETGLFCKVADPEDLADKIVRVLKDGQLREKIINNGKALVAEKYDWNIIADKFSKLYGELI